MPEANFPKSLHYVCPPRERGPVTMTTRMTTAVAPAAPPGEASSLLQDADAERLRGTAQRAPGPPNSRMIF